MRLNGRMGKMAGERVILAATFESGKVANRQAPYPIHAVNLSRGQGSGIQEVLGNGSGSYRGASVTLPKSISRRFHYITYVENSPHCRKRGKTSWLRH